jgi:hypothetical protein
MLLSLAPLPAWLAAEGVHRGSALAAGFLRGRGGPVARAARRAHGWGLAALLAAAVALNAGPILTCAPLPWNRTRPPVNADDRANAGAVALARQIPPDTEVLADLRAYRLACYVTGNRTRTLKSVRFRGLEPAVVLDRVAAGGAGRILVPRNAERREHLWRPVRDLLATDRRFHRIAENADYLLYRPSAPPPADTSLSPSVP